MATCLSGKTIHAAITNALLAKQAQIPTASLQDLAFPEEWREQDFQIARMAIMVRCPQTFIRVV